MSKHLHTTRLDQIVAYRMYRMGRLLRQYHVQVLARESAGVSPEQFLMMMRLFDGGPCSQVELGDPALGDRPNITRMLSRLASQGLVSKSPDPDDGRRSRVELTADGRALIERLMPAVVAERTRLFEGFEDADLDPILRIFDTLEARLNS